MEKPGIGIVGCGAISGIYLKNLYSVIGGVDVVACADLDATRMAMKAREYPGVKAQSVEDLMQNDTVDVVLNLTTPQGHFPIAMQALEAGKHVYNEKPLVLTRDEGRQLLDTASRKKLLVGCAPDTFMGGGIQTCRKLIDQGEIGTVLGAQAFMLCRGHESWHPDPEFYYQTGGGPMFDMGPYYLTALVSLMGPVRRVTGSARISMPTRTITSEKKNGKVIDVEVPTHVSGIMDFESGAIGTITTSFDVTAAQVPRIEIFGTKGTVSVPDPNTFGGPIKMKCQGEKEWRDIPLSGDFSENSRGIGVADMALAGAEGRAYSATGKLGFHILDIMHAIHDASESGCHIILESEGERPAAFDSSKIL